MTLIELLALFGIQKNDIEIKEIVGERKGFVGEGEFIPKSIRPIKRKKN